MLFELIIAAAAYAAAVVTWPALRTMLRGKHAEIDAMLARVKKLQADIKS